MSNKNNIYRISTLPIILLFSLLWFGIILLFLILKYINFNEIYEMIIAGAISSVAISLFMKYIIKVEVYKEGIESLGDDNKNYFVKWNEVEKIKVKRIINIRFLVIYFNNLNQSISIPLFLRRKKQFINEILQVVPVENILREYFAKEMVQRNKVAWSGEIEREVFLKKMKETELIFEGSVAIFYLIGFLSIINNIINLITDKNAIYIIGLGLNKIINKNIFTLPNVLMVSRLLSFWISGLFILLGYYASKRIKEVFIIGMILYMVDLFILLYLREYGGCIFHGLLLIGIAIGIEQANLLEELEEQLRK